jgi:hypothetical protein
MDKETIYKKYMKKMSELHHDYPDLAYLEAKAGLNRLGVKIEDEKDTINLGIFGEVKKFTLIRITIIAIIALIGLINIPTLGEESIMYYGGIIFFLAGFYVGIYVKGIGIIFLFSHGGTGIGLMIASQIGKYLDSPVLSDISFNVSLYFAIGIAIMIFATLFAIVFNLSDKLKQNKYLELVPLSLYGIVLLMAALFSHII